jgi:superfamily II DNA or RNA helicase
MTDLRAYQSEIIKQIHEAIAAGYRRILIIAPTASGKTVIISDIVKDFRAQFKPVLALAHTREIVTQTRDELAENGVRAGIILAGEDERPMELVQVASIQTLWSRAYRNDVMPRPSASLLVIDEAHRAPARTYQKIVESYPDAILLGATATPCRGDGRGLGSTFEIMLQCPQVAELQELGFLVKAKVYAPVNPDLRGVETRNGDYAENQLADRMDRPKLIGDIVTHWHKFAAGQKTVVFACSVAHSMHIRDEFCHAGVRAEHIDGSTPKPERDATLARLASGEIQVVTNCMVLTEGWNMPEVACCVLARPTKRMGLYRQTIGRVLRPAPGKEFATILDHSGAVFRHGLPEDRVEWTLDEDKKATSPVHAARSQKPAGGLIECTNCTGLRVGGQPCPCCGFMPQRPAECIPIHDGELGLVRNGKAKAAEHDRAKWNSMLAYIARERGYKPGWAAYKYKEKFNEWPPRGDVTLLPPNAEVRSWVRSRNIAWAKSRNRAAG